MRFHTKAGRIVEREVVHHSGTKETPPEEEILSSLLHRSTALLTGLIGYGRRKRKGCLVAQQDPFHVKYTHPHSISGGAAVTLMTLCSTTESSHSMKDSTVAFFLSSSFSSWKTVMESSGQNKAKILWGTDGLLHGRHNRFSFVY